MDLISIIFKLILLLIVFFAFTYFVKKIKKYISIFNINGLDGVYYYFKNKNFKNYGIWNFIDNKKYKLGKKLAEYSKEKILFGPYSGTKFIFKSGWSNTDFGSKYLGTYERQIQKKIIYLKKKFNLNFFVDCGAAEGFHIISLLKKKIFKTAVAFEINKKSRDLLIQNAINNNVKKKISVYSEANFASLKKLKIKNFKKTLFLLDIEGAEFNLFDKNFCRYFSKSFFIIEDHNFIILNKKKTNSFYKTIKKFFKVEFVDDNFENPLNYKILDNLTEDEKYLILSEGRPLRMQWIILLPK